MSKAVQGSCFCGKVRIEYTGEPAMKVLPLPPPTSASHTYIPHRFPDLILQALCHCLDCRKISGSAYSTNIAVPEDNFKLLSGTPKTFTTNSGSNKSISNHFCGDCGTTLTRTGDAFAGLVIIKVGVMDDVDAFKDLKPGVELFSGQRVDWVDEIEGAQQLKAMT